MSALWPGEGSKSINRARVEPHTPVPLGSALPCRSAAANGIVHIGPELQVGVSIVLPPVDWGRSCVATCRLRWQLHSHPCSGIAAQLVNEYSIFQFKTLLSHRMRWATMQQNFTRTFLQTRVAIVCNSLFAKHFGKLGSPRICPPFYGRVLHRQAAQFADLATLQTCRESTLLPNPSECHLPSPTENRRVARESRAPCLSILMYTLTKPAGISSRDFVPRDIFPAASVVKPGASGDGM